MQMRAGIKSLYRFLFVFIELYSVMIIKQVCLRFFFSRLILTLAFIRFKLFNISKEINELECSVYIILIGISVKRNWVKNNACNEQPTSFYKLLSLLLNIIMKDFILLRKSKKKQFQRILLHKWQLFVCWWKYFWNVGVSLTHRYFMQKMYVYLDFYFSHQQRERSIMM